MRHGSLFSGIGGFDLAAEWMGWENVFHCEYNSFCQKILKHYWPDAESYGDIKTTDFTVHRGSIDILTGGFPCQPFSTAGKRKGTGDDRYLWPEMLRAIREIQPGWIVGENVSGLINWDRGLVFEQVQADLEDEGYQSQAYVLPACAKDAPHRRDRVWIIAHSGSTGGVQHRDALPDKQWNDKDQKRERNEQQNGVRGCVEKQDVAHSNNARVRASNGTANGNGQATGKEWEEPQPEHNGYDKATANSENKNGRLYKRKKTEHTQFRINGKYGITSDTEKQRFQEWDAEQAWDGTYPTIKRHDGIPGWRDFPTQSPVCGGDDGIPDRIHRIKALGNAVVPQVVYEIFKAIEQANNLTS